MIFMNIEQSQLPGTLLHGSYIAKDFIRNAVFGYTVYVPEICQKQEACALLVNHDGLNSSEALALEQLATTKEAPPCIVIGIDGGTLPSTLAGGWNRGMRMRAYDVFGPEFPAFVVEEFIPWIVREYNLSISDSPDMHMVSGGSSGGVSAWNMAWYQTDYFHRVYMSSPSNLSMGRGRELTALIRKYETKPIRVFTEYSENEPDDYFGSSFCAADDVERALRFAGYDMKSRYIPGEGHCSRHFNFEDALERMRFLWENWKTEPIKVTKLSSRAEQLITSDSPWEKVNESFPEKETVVSTGEYSAAGTYVAEEEDIYFVPENGKRRKVAEGIGKIASLSISSDCWLLYIGVLDRGCVYAMSICPDGSLSGKYLHGSCIWRQISDTRGLMIFVSTAMTESSLPQSPEYNAYVPSV